MYAYKASPMLFSFSGQSYDSLFTLPINKLTFFHMHTVPWSCHNATMRNEHRHIGTRFQWEMNANNAPWESTYPYLSLTRTKKTNVLPVK